MAKNNNLNDFFTDIADALRSKIPAPTANAKTAEQYNTLLTEKTGYGVNTSSHFNSSIVGKDHRIYFVEMKNTNDQPYLLSIDAWPAIISTEDVTISMSSVASDNFSTISKFNSLLTDNIGWTVTQAIYNYLYSNLFSLISSYPNIVVFGTDRGGQAQDLWFVYNNSSGETFDISDLTFLRDSSGCKFVNGSSITLKVGRMYGYGAGNTVVDSNPGFVEGTVAANGTFQASAMEGSSVNYVGDPFQSANQALSFTTSHNLNTSVVTFIWFHLKNGAWGDNTWGDEAITDPGETVTIQDMSIDGNPFTNKIPVEQKYSPTQFADLIRNL